MKIAEASNDGESQALLGKAGYSKAEIARESGVEHSDGNPQLYSSMAMPGANDDGDDDGSLAEENRNAAPLSSRSPFCKSVFVSITSLALLFAIVRPSYTHINNVQPTFQLVHGQSQDQDEQKEEQTVVMFEGSYSAITNEPLSYVSPAELGIQSFNRPENSRPGSVFGSVQQGSQMGVPLPTNEWYLNLIVGLDEDPGQNGKYDNYVGEANRVYTIPYIVDTVGTVVGLRLHYPNVLSYGTVIQTNFIPEHGLALGTDDEGFTRQYQVDEDTLPSKLGIGIRWKREGQSKQYIRSSILRGMPYGTMEYAPGVHPVISSEVVAKLPIIDGSNELQCGTLDPHSNRVVRNSTSVLVKKDVELYFLESDFTWLVFFSRPVHVQCYINPNKNRWMPPGSELPDDNPNAFQLRVDPAQDTEDEQLIVRVALGNNCTTGRNVHFCDQNKAQDHAKFMAVLREHASVYPTSPTVTYAFSNPEGGLAPDRPDSKSAYLFFDWKAKSFHRDTTKELITFALPHHVDILRQLDGDSSNQVIGNCMHSLHGNACLVKGGLWAMEEGKLILLLYLYLFSTK